jgi:hypothetical protein
MVTLILDILGGIGLVAGIVFGVQLWRWERLLKGTRVAVSFKGKRQMTPRLIDWLVWAQRLEGDKQVNGQVIYSKGGTTLALLKLLPKDHGKTTTRTIKEPA